MHWILRVTSGALALALQGFAGAQMATESNPAGTYDQAFFADFRPQTALDMIERVPGFSIDSGSELRGFGAGAGNVLINGSRPSSKVGGAVEALLRIPAPRVMRIDVLGGVHGATETAGQMLIADVILHPVARSGRWELGASDPADGRVSMEGEISLSTGLGDWDTATSLAAAYDRRPLTGTRESRDAGGVLELRQLEDSPLTIREYALSSLLGTPWAGGALAITARLGKRSVSLQTVRRGFDADPPATTRQATVAQDQLFLLDQTRPSTSAELGVDWKRSLDNDWNLKLLSLSAVDRRQAVQDARTERPLGNVLRQSLFSSDQESFESVIRGTLSRVGSRPIRPEFGLEMAYNRLDSRLSLLVGDGNEQAVAPLPAANVVVDEWRVEAFANLIFPVGNRTNVEASLGGELSWIDVTGDAISDERFSYLKPAFFVSHTPRTDLQLRGGVRRTIGQLDFRDFAASASAADDRLTAGNPGLGPDQTTRASLAADWRSRDGQAAINLELFHEWRDDILEDIVLPSGGLGIGNAGSARVWGLDLDASTTLDSLVRGGLLEIEAQWLDSSFDDPLIGQLRDVSNTDSPNIEVRFRQDLPEAELGWGISYRAPFKGTFYFADEESYNEDGRVWNAFAETTRWRGLKVKLALEGIGDEGFLRQRRLFEGDRSGELISTERIDRGRGMTLRLSVSRQF